LMEQCYDKRIGMLFVIGDVEQPSEKHWAKTWMTRKCGRWNLDGEDAGTCKGLKWCWSSCWRSKGRRCEVTLDMWHARAQVLFQMQGEAIGEFEAREWINLLCLMQVMLAVWCVGYREQEAKMNVHW
jgi:hypothetical protein